MDNYTATGIAEGFIEAADEEQVIEAWQHLIDTRLAFQLQGVFGRQARAKALTGGVSRKYPKHTPGMSTQQYVMAFAILNARATGYGIQRGSFLSVTDIDREQKALRAFFEPLSDAPQFADVDTTIEEFMA